jgi:hypothetical protein
MKYYIQKRYIEKEQQVKTFMKPGENIFKAESRLPGNFWTGLDQVSGQDIDPELPPKDIVPYLCHIRGIMDIKKVKAIINRLGIEDFKYFDRRKPAEVSAEDLEKIYAALMLSEVEDRKIILINNLLSGVSKQFDRQFIALLQDLNGQGKKVVYLSDEIYMSVLAGDLFEIPPGDDFATQRINLKHVSLR